MLPVSFTTCTVQPGVQNARYIGTQKTSLAGCFVGSFFETRTDFKLFGYRVFRPLYDASNGKGNEHFAVLNNGELCDGFDI
jgi:hypothetical protein